MRMYCAAGRNERDKAVISIKENIKVIEKTRTITCILVSSYHVNAIFQISKDHLCDFVCYKIML